MALLDDINRLLRDHVGYTGDGQGGNGALPVGDRSTMRNFPDMRIWRELLKAIAQAMGDPSALQEILTQLAGKADLANSGRFFTSRAAAAAMDQASLPGTLGLIFHPGTDELVVRQFSATTDDPLFSTAPRWGVVLRVPSADLLAGKADLANSGKTFVSRAAAEAFGQQNLPSSLGQIETREGYYRVLRSATATADDPLFETSPRWGVVGRYPDKTIVDADRDERNNRDSVGQVILISDLTNTTGAAYSGKITTRQQGIVPVASAIFQLTPNFTNTAARPNVTVGAETFEIRRGDGTFVQAGELIAGRPLLMRRTGEQMRLTTPTSPSDVGAKPASANALTINAGAVYPLKSVSRNGVVSAARAGLMDAILDLKVKGAEPGKFYRLEVYGNGGTSGATTGWGARINEYDAATYDTENSTGTMLLDFREQLSAPEGYPIGVKTYSIPTRPGMTVTLVIDRAAAAEGTVWTMNSAGAPAANSFSWVIDPTRYEYGSSPVAGASAGAMGVFMTPGGDMSVSWQSGNRWYRVTIGPNGFNSLPNIKSVAVAPDAGGAPGSWTTYATGSTDWLPPLTFAAAANGDGATSAIYTGGNHGSNGDASGQQTAINRVWRSLVDGQPRTWSEFEGKADRVDLTIVNDLLAFNTITLGRYALRQVLSLSITPGGIEVHAEHIPLEAVELRIDNGLQIVTTGFQTEATILGGDPAASGAFQNTTDAGVKSAYPKAWSALFRNASSDQMTVWMDRTYGAGDAAMVANDRPLIRPNYGSASGKWYHAVAAGTTTPLAAGQSYKWRGGYQWGKAGRPAPFSQGFDMSCAGRRHDVLITGPSDWIVAPAM